MLSTPDIGRNSDRLTPPSHIGISLRVLLEFFLPPREYRPAGLAFLLAVLLVAALRLASPTCIYYDQGIQVQTAERLQRGEGLTTFLNWHEETTRDPAVLDISQPRKQRSLTEWPFGYALQLALWRQLGCSLPTALKIFPLFCHLLGWAGWWWFAKRVMAARPSPNLWMRLIVTSLALAMPLFFTPTWPNTDIYLWAATPWFFLLLARSSRGQSDDWKWSLALGICLGISFTIRYATVSHILLCGLLYVLAMVDGGKWRVRPLASYIVGFAIAAAPLLLFNFLAGQSSALPDGYVLGQLREPFAKAFLEKIPADIPTALRPLLFWLPEQYAKIFFNNPLLTPLRWLLTLFILTAPCLMARATGTPWRFAIREPLVAATWLLPTIVAVNTWMSFIHHGHFLLEIRYYYPCEQAYLLILLFLATNGAIENRADQVGKIFARLFLAFVLFFCTIRLLFLAWPSKTPAQIPSLIGHPPYPAFPSNLLINDTQPDKRDLFALLKANPGSVAYIEQCGPFFYDLSVEGQRLRRLSGASFWSRAYTSRPVTLFWLSEVPAELLPKEKAASSRIHLPIHRAPFQIIATYPELNRILLRADLPAGFQFGDEPLPAP